MWVLKSNTCPSSTFVPSHDLFLVALAAFIYSNMSFDILPHQQPWLNFQVYTVCSPVWVLPTVNHWISVLLAHPSVSRRFQKFRKWTRMRVSPRRFIQDAGSCWVCIVKGFSKCLWCDSNFMQRKKSEYQVYQWSVDYRLTLKDLRGF